MPNKFDRLFNPRGIAVVGASQDASRHGGQLLLSLAKYGYTGRVHPVNPRYTAIGDYRCYPSVKDIDGPCDLAVITLPPAATLQAVHDCAARGVAFAVIHSAGYREAGPEGVAREQVLVEAARAGGVRLIGPNCLGVVNATQGVYAAFGPVTRNPPFAKGAVSIVSQSGGFGYTLAHRCAQAGAGIRYFVTSGNEADVTALECMDAYLDDAQTRVVLAYIEGVNDGRELMRLGHKAATLGKPILLWKAGRREQGQRAAASHTASMTGRYDIYQAALKQAGIFEVNDIELAADLARVFAAGKLPAGPRVAVTGGSGGAAIVFADACDELGLEIPALAPATVEALRVHAPGVSTRGNPVDFVGGWLSDANAPKFGGVIDGFLADDNIDQVCVMFSTVDGKAAANGARLLADASRRSSKPISVFASAPSAAVAEAFAVFAEAGIPVLDTPVRLAHVAAATAAYPRARARVLRAAAVAPCQSTQARLARVTLNEVHSKALLADAGIAVTRDVLVTNVVPEDLGYPLVLKVVSADLPHKSDVGGVRLGIRDRAGLITAMSAMQHELARAAPHANIEGYLACENVENAVEMIAGVINDDVFGPTVLVGMGGTLAEVMHDVSYRVAPFDVETAHAMIRELKGSAVLHGVRGHAACDVDALADALCKLSQFAWARRDDVRELDINPLFVRQAGAGVIAADALAVIDKND